MTGTVRYPKSSIREEVREMSRIVNRLVEASGGWEHLLYETLKDMCEQLDYSESGVCGNITEDVKEILEAYEELDRAPEGKKVPVVIDDQSIKKTKEPRVAPVFTQTRAGEVEPAKDVEWKLEDLVRTPAARPKANSRTLTGRVHVDKDIGGSSGELPLPADHKLVNRQTITITTLNGLVLGTATAADGEEGQIKGQHVTGHVSVNGKYRLAFTNTTLGAAHINYEVVALPTKLTSKQFETAIALANKLSVPELQERLEHFGMVYQACLCGKVDCFGWNIVDRADVLAVEAERKSRMQAQRNLGVGGGLPA